jgi:hypothetical protein
MGTAMVEVSRVALLLRITSFFNFKELVMTM